MRSGALLLGLAKYIYYLCFLLVMSTQETYIREKKIWIVEVIYF